MFMEKLRSWPLFYHLVIAFIVTLSVMFVFVGWLSESREKEYLEKQHINHAIQTFSVVAATSLEAIITEDRAVLSNVINRIVNQDPNIVSVLITNEEGYTLAQYTQSDITDSSDIETFTKDFILQGEHFGSIAINWSSVADNQHIYEHVLDQQLLILLSLFVMAGSLIIWVYWIIVKPIEKTCHHLRGFELGLQQKPLTITFPKEISRLAEAVNRLGNLLLTHKERDALTGLYNRAKFEATLTDLLSQGHRNSSTHALLYLDLDQFKVINDTNGHIAGDELLKELSEVLSTQVRQDDCFARIGGDEFALIVKNCDIDGAQHIANKLLDAIRGFRFTWKNQLFELRGSIGIAVISSNSKQPEEILSQADVACYMAKDLGRNRIHVYHEYDEELQSRHEEMRQVSRINKAITEERLVLYFQEIVPVDSRQTSGRHFEILLRMKGNDGTLIPPGLFLPAAERFNLMASIDRFVISEALDFLNRTNESSDQVGLCSINISGQSFCSDNFLEFLVEEVTRSSFPAQKLCFEITETVAISNMVKVKKVMNRLKAVGCRFALDDFGSGMSSFGYLKSLPVDYLKIDGQFVKNIKTDPVDRIIVNSINEVGHSLGIRTIAEFVENDDILEVLGSLGVDFAQGYGIARPQPLHQLKFEKTISDVAL